jgi:hypothetical protein
VGSGVQAKIDSKRHIDVAAVVALPRGKLDRSRRLFARCPACVRRGSVGWEDWQRWMLVQPCLAAAAKHSHTVLGYASQNPGTLWQPDYFKPAMKRCSRASRSDISDPNASQKSFTRSVFEYSLNAGRLAVRVK